MSHHRHGIGSMLLIAAVLLQVGCDRRADNQAPSVVFSASQESAEQMTSYAFSSKGSVDSDGTIVSYAWDFGDGARSVEPSPVHTYRTSGSFVVKLTLTDNDGATASATRTVDIRTPAVSVAVGTAATTLTLARVATVEVPEATFPAPTRIGVWVTENSATAAEFELTAQMFTAPLRAKQEIRVNTGQLKPLKTLTVTANLDPELAARMQANDEAQVFVQIFQDGGEEVLDSFELVSSAYDAGSNTLRFALDPDMFTNRRNVDESWEAVIVVGSTRTKPTSPARTMAPSSALGKSGEAEAVRPWPRFAIPGLLDFSAPADTVRSAASAVPECEGSSLQAPLANLTVTGAYNPPKHYGADYRAPDGTEVRSMADGKVFKVGFDERPLPEPDPRSGKRVKGWGNYVVIEHGGGSKSLYAHLQTGDIKVSVGDTVTAGEAIALSDNSGGSQASHLHVEYAPSGEIFRKGSKVDPHACIGQNIDGNVQVRDNGTLADDAFSVSINGRQICTTAIGAANRCSIGALRSGTASLSITATVAPDNVGTYEITLSGGLTFQDGGSMVSGTIGQGASATFVISAP
ncbi:peptidoglycan DD-metalloendopeptidase family protein [Massilia sp.]|uniref:peptidoglycan DD-metalloendopeptidase family protein n=1 Tax=Massilia sp. TaxID=1882437 RepID=UPI00391DA8E0